MIVGTGKRKKYVETHFEKVRRLRREIELLEKIQDGRTFSISIEIENRKKERNCLVAMWEHDSMEPFPEEWL